MPQGSAKKIYLLPIPRTVRRAHLPSPKRHRGWSALSTPQHELIEHVETGPEIVEVVPLENQVRFLVLL
jgi:hypothetical protein